MGSHSLYKEIKKILYSNNLKLVTAPYVGFISTVVISWISCVFHGSWDILFSYTFKSLKSGCILQPLPTY